ncbi:unnamed protein product [Lampetra planeri]
MTTHPVARHDQGLPHRCGRWLTCGLTPADRSEPGGITRVSKIKPRVAEEAGGDRDENGRGATSEEVRLVRQGRRQVLEPRPPPPPPRAFIAAISSGPAPATRQPPLPPPPAALGSSFALRALIGPPIRRADAAPRCWGARGRAGGDADAGMAAMRSGWRPRYSPRLSDGGKRGRGAREASREGGEGRGGGHRPRDVTSTPAIDSDRIDL